MNNKWLKIVLPVLIVLATVSGVAAQRPVRANDRQVATLLNRIETRTDRFRNNLDQALDQGRFDGTAQEDEINRAVQEFENATDRLREQFRAGRPVASDVSAVLTKADYINSFMRTYQMGNPAERDWNALRADLQRLANRYNVAWRWDTTPINPPYGNTASSLNGTFRLNSGSSDNIYTVADRAVARLRVSERQVVRDEITRRLVTPDQLALQLGNNNQVTIASTLAPQMTLNADGRVYQERTANGRVVGVATTLKNETLAINYTGDLGADYTATFNPQQTGRRLLVTRRIYVSRLRQTVTANTYYDKTSSVAQFDLYRNNDGTANYRGTFIVPNNTALSGTLNQDLSTRTATVGERFTMTVTSPNTYYGATLEGYVANVERSGRVTGRAKMTLDFDRIRLRDGNTYSFAGTLDGIRFANGQTATVDTEGVVRDGDNQTNRTVTRTGIGTAVGAIIGAVAGGGKGAAIGAAIGAGVGAGSVIAQGREDLELRSGTEITVRASAPANTAALR